MTKTHHLPHRELFSLPPISPMTAVPQAAVQIPPRAVVTGDKEVDVVIWLRELIETGNPALTEMARQEAARLKSPREEVEKRYASYLCAQRGGDVIAALSSIGVTNLEELEVRVARDMQRRVEALARFGTPGALLADVPAEVFASEALRGLKRGKDQFFLDPDQVDARFMAWPEQLPRTLSECIAELTYWRDLGHLRHSFDGVGDALPAAFERECFVRRRLAVIPPESAAEALVVFDFMQANDLMDQLETPDILRNLVAGPHFEPAQFTTSPEASNT